MGTETPEDEGLGSAATPQRGQAQARPHPFDGWSRERLAELVDGSLESLGSLSLGSPNFGRLLNGIELPDAPEWKKVDPRNAWGTQETIDYLTVAVRAVRAAHPETQAITIGDISAKKGGPLSPHRSHQSGRDVDVGYYYGSKDVPWYTIAHEGNLDLARTWTFVRALLIETDVEMILADHSVLELLERHAVGVGEDETWVHGVFHDGGRSRAILRHAQGHRTHLHVRFYNPIAQESARRLHAILVERGLASAPVAYQSYRCVRGDTLAKIAKRYNTTVSDIKKANGLRKSAIVAGKTYRIPRLGASVPPVVIPPRRLPPASRVQ